ERGAQCRGPGKAQLLRLPAGRHGETAVAIGDQFAGWNPVAIVENIGPGQSLAVAVEPDDRGVAGKALAVERADRRAELVAGARGHRKSGRVVHEMLVWMDTQAGRPDPRRRGQLDRVGARLSDQIGQL